MDVKATREPGAITATVTGRFDAHSTDTYLAAIADHIDVEHANVITDLSGVEFMDSSALAAMVTTLKRCMEHGGDVVIVAAADAVRIILELTRLDQVFGQAPSIEAARSMLLQTVS
jgi:anti-sigma B factor antagonist